MAEDKMENGYELWLKCCDNTKSGEVKRFLEVPLCFKKILYLGEKFFPPVFEFHEMRSFSHDHVAFPGAGSELLKQVPRLDGIRGAVLISKDKQYGTANLGGVVEWLIADSVIKVGQRSVGRLNGR